MKSKSTVRRIAYQDLGKAAVEIVKLRDQLEKVEKERDEWKSKGQNWEFNHETIRLGIERAEKAESQLREVEKCVTAAQALKKKILRPNGNLIFDGDAIEAFFDGLPKE